MDAGITYLTYRALTVFFMCSFERSKWFVAFVVVFFVCSVVHLPFPFFLCFDRLPRPVCLRTRTQSDRQSIRREIKTNMVFCTFTYVSHTNTHALNAICLMPSIGAMNKTKTRGQEIPWYMSLLFHV